MRIKLTSILLALMVPLFFSSCEKEDFKDGPEQFETKKKPSNPGLGGGGGNNGGKGKGNQDPPPPPPPPIIYEDTYILENRVDFDPLYKFSFSQGDTLVLFQTDSTITTWGTDYWGAWDEPYEFINNRVHYIKGLTNVTYDFTPLAGDRYSIQKTLLVSQYLSNTVDTTITNLGTYILEP